MKNATLRLLDSLWIRAGLFLTGLAILAAVYLFQRINLAGFLGDFAPNVVFVMNRTARLIINDFACFLIIFALFQQAKYLKMAFWIFLIEMFVILPVYLMVKLSLEGDSEISSPMLSPIHRLIVNPMLMLLLIAGFLFQRYIKR